MATKNNPGPYDCYANAEDDEPMFILLARDPLAPILTRLWADLRRANHRIGDSAHEKANEASLVAEAMTEWRKKKQREREITDRGY